MLKRSLYPSFLAAVGVLFALLIWEMPLFMDDLNFSIPVADGSSWLTKMESAVRVWREKYFSDVFRLPNQFTPFMLMVMPKWLKAIMMSGILLLMLEGGRRAMRLTVDSGLCYAWILVAMVALPWYDMMVSTVFFMNYILCSALTLWLLHFILNRAPQLMSRSRFASILLLAFLSGWGHEAFGSCEIFFIATLALFSIKNNKTAAKRLAFVMLAVAAGTLMIFSSPAIWGRVARENSLSISHPFWEWAIQLGPAMLCVFVFLVIAAIFAKRNKLAKVVTFATIVSFLPAIIIGIKYYNGPRTYWPLMLFAIFSSFYILSHSAGQWWRKKGVYCITASISILIVIGNLGYALYLQPRYTREMQEVINLYQAKSGNGGDVEIFADISQPEIDLSLLKTSARALNERTSLYFIMKYYGGNESLRLLPKQLENFEGIDSDAGTMVAGNVVVIKDSDYSKYMNRAATLKLHTQDGEIASRYRAELFHAKDSAQYVVLIPHATRLNPQLTIHKATIE